MFALGVSDKQLFRLLFRMRFSVLVELTLEKMRCKRVCSPSLTPNCKNVDMALNFHGKPRWTQACTLLVFRKPQTSESCATTVVATCLQVNLRFSNNVLRCTKELTNTFRRKKTVLVATKSAPGAPLRFIASIRRHVTMRNFVERASCVKFRCGLPS